MAHTSPEPDWRSLSTGAREIGEWLWQRPDPPLDGAGPLEEFHLAIGSVRLAVRTDSEGLLCGLSKRYFRAEAAPPGNPRREVVVTRRKTPPADLLFQSENRIVATRYSRESKLFYGALDRDTVKLLAGSLSGVALSFAADLGDEDRLNQAVLEHELLSLAREGDTVFLHATAVAHSQAVALLLGGPMSGKTTAAFALCEQGWRLVSDDVTGFDAARSLVTSFPRRLHPRAECCQLFDRVRLRAILAQWEQSWADGHTPAVEKGSRIVLVFLTGKPEGFWRRLESAEAIPLIVKSMLASSSIPARVRMEAMFRLAALPCYALPRISLEGTCDALRRIAEIADAG